MALTPERWTHPSVRALAQDRDPVTAISELARALVIDVMDKGWRGPPFDPLALADLLEIEVSPTEEVQDARLLASETGKPRIEYNPSRPRRRLRYTLAHEIAHTLFDDWASQVRHRGGPDARSDDWQLEALCNIAAAEFLMPVGDCGRVAEPDAGIDTFLEEQKRFEVSTEALFIRAMHFRQDQCAMFCASREEDGPRSGRYRLDYLIGARHWTSGVFRSGNLLPERSVVAGCTAIGFTAKGDEEWSSTKAPFHVECVGIPPYPGRRFPKVVGLVQNTSAGIPAELEDIQYLVGNALEPRGEGRRIIAHVVNDKAAIWGGGGFAAALRRAFGAAQEDFVSWVREDANNNVLGHVRLCPVRDDLVVASMVAQRGYGESSKPRIRYVALRECLAQVARYASEWKASVHMPRIGCGLAGGSWDVVEELIRDTLVASGVETAVYTRPEDVPPKRMQHALSIAAPVPH